MSMALPERFGDYELIERLGVGGMAETFVALRRGVGGFTHAATEEGETKGIVHRDVSPSNVLVSNWGELKLADFGRIFCWGYALLRA